MLASCQIMSVTINRCHNYVPTYSREPYDLFLRDGYVTCGRGKGSFERRVNTFFTCRKIGFNGKICLNYLNSNPRVKWCRGVPRLFSLPLQKSNSWFTRLCQPLIVLPTTTTVNYVFQD